VNETITTIVGNVVDAPNRRQLESGVSVTSFRVASSARRFDRVTNQWVDGDSLYLKVTCWRGLADNVSRSIVKGDPVVVTGRLYSRLYEVEEGRRAAYELQAQSVGFDLNRGVGTFKRLPKRGATVDEVGADGIPSGSAIDAYLDAARAGEDEATFAEQDGFGGSEGVGGPEEFGGADGSDAYSGADAFGGSDGFGSGDEFGGSAGASLGSADFTDDPFGAADEPPSETRPADAEAPNGADAAPAKRPSSSRRRGAGATLA
jgi:single-strand DNA-binding protein